jgi:hypothetical protein
MRPLGATETAPATGARVLCAPIWMTRARIFVPLSVT